MAFLNDQLLQLAIDRLSPGDETTLEKLYGAEWSKVPSNQRAILGKEFFERVGSGEFKGISEVRRTAKASERGVGPQRYLKKASHA